MPLRLVELAVPVGEAGRLSQVLEGQPYLHLWLPDAGEAGTARILIEAQDTEKLSDLLVRHFGSQENFRLVLLPVEATAPPIAPPAPPAAEAGPEPEVIRVGPRRISREELYEDVAHATELTRTYVVMVALSTVVAAVGLIRGDVAIIIGAMVIAPLLGPNIGLSLAAALGDPRLAARSLKAIGAGIAVAGSLSVLLGAALDFDRMSAEILARTRPGMGDIILALAAGAAGSLAFTSGVPAIVVGVMVAVALLPPLVVAGLLAGAGETRLATSAVLLAFINVTCINLAAVVTFLLQRVRPRTWWEADRARRATKFAVATWILMLLALWWLMTLGRLREV